MFPFMGVFFRFLISLVVFSVQIFHIIKFIPKCLVLMLLLMRLFFWGAGILLSVYRNAADFYSLVMYPTILQTFIDLF